MKKSHTEDPGSIINQSKKNAQAIQSRLDKLCDNYHLFLAVLVHRRSISVDFKMSFELLIYLIKHGSCLEYLVIQEPEEAKGSQVKRLSSDSVIESANQNFRSMFLLQLIISLQPQLTQQEIRQLSILIDSLPYIEVVSYIYYLDKQYKKAL